AFEVFAAGKFFSKHLEIRNISVFCLSDLHYLDGATRIFRSDSLAINVMISQPTWRHCQKHRPSASTSMVLFPKQQAGTLRPWASSATGGVELQSLRTQHIVCQRPERHGSRE
ncbi:unnamed protein product, partial [Ixodes persulcatus]